MAQNLEIVGREFEVTDRIRDYVTKKVARLDRYLGNIEDIRIDLAHIKSARSASDRYVCQMTVRGKGFLLRSEERADDVRTSTDAAVDKMERQIDRYKGKHYHGRGNGKSVSEATTESEVTGGIENEEPPTIVRRKKFELIPMDELEAIEQMKLLGHDNFFLFYNVKLGGINVLYRRRDGTYGLIEPVVR